MHAPTPPPVSVAPAPHDASGGRKLWYGFLRDLEIWLSLAGIVVIVGVPLLLGENGSVSWQVVLAVALGVTVLHGLIFWGVRRRQRRIREQTIAAIRRMLRDRVTNKLGLVLMQLELMDDIEDDQRDALASVQRNVTAVTDLMGDLSSESLRAWQKRFDAFEQRFERDPHF